MFRKMGGKVLLLSALVLAGTSAGIISINANASATVDKLACGKACIKKGQYQRAVQDLQAYVKEQPKSCEGHLLLGQAYCKVHNFLQARHELRTAIRTGRGSPNAQKANQMLMTLPKNLLSPRSGAGTRMLASMLGLTSTRGTAAKPTVIDFYASWCQPCKQLNQVLEKAKGEYGDKINFMTVDVDDPNNDKLIDQYEVSPIPTLIFLNPEGDVVTFSVGFSGGQSLDAGLKKILAQG